MVITTDINLKIKNLITDLYHGQNIQNQDKIGYAVSRVCIELENRPVSDIEVDDNILKGAEVAVALLFTGPSTPEIRDGKKYMKYYDDYISVLVSTNSVKLVRCSVPISRPNGWGDEEDWIQESPIYTTATRRDLDGIYEMLF